MTASPPRPAPAPPSRAAAPPLPPVNREALVEDILARPLFATNRRPADAPAAGPAATPVGLPRLTGIMVHGDGRSAIFAATGSGRPAVVGEGGSVNGYTVTSIEAGQVTLDGPGGKEILRPAFDLRAQGAPAGPPGIPGLSGIPGIPSLPGAGPGAKPPTSFAPADVLQSLRGLQGLPGVTAR